MTFPCRHLLSVFDNTRVNMQTCTRCHKCASKQGTARQGEIGLKMNQLTFASNSYVTERFFELTSESMLYLGSNLLMWNTKYS